MSKPLTKDAGKDIKWSRLQRAMPPGYELQKFFPPETNEWFWYLVIAPDGTKHRTSYFQYAVGRSWSHLTTGTFNWK